MTEENFDISPFGDVRFVVTFPNTTSAMAFATACEQNGVAGRLVPIPQSMHAGCGQAWSAPLSARAALQAVMAKPEIRYNECTIFEF